ncbi:MAG: hypothetical protein ACAH22_02325 [Tardiphaga sp.]
MANSIHVEAIELLLSSMYCKAGEDGLRSSFMWGRPGPHSHKGFGTTVFYRRKLFIRAVLHVRRNGPVHLRHFAIDVISSKLSGFISDNYWCLSEDTFFKQFDRSYAEYVSPEVKFKLANLLEASELFSPNRSLSLFPLVPVRVESDFMSESFFLVRPESLGAHLPIDWLEWFAPEHFPPLKRWEGKQETPSSWLGVRSPAIQSSVKMKAAALGAVALTPRPRYRHLFSYRHVYGGWCELSDTISTSFGDPHTPPMAEDIVITSDDHPWLFLLHAKLSSTQKDTRRQIRALEYFYKAWPLEPGDRFPLLCMTLDAIFGDENHATESFIEGIKATIGSHVDDKRLRLLTRLRGSVVHGGAPDVYDSSKYAKYFETYGQDPVYDLELVAAQCLRTVIFDGCLKEHADPNAPLFAALQATGQLPSNLDENTILSG